MRTAVELDGINYAPEQKMRVLQPCKWRGWKAIVGGHQGASGNLKPGDIVTCKGFGAGWGSDPGYGVEFVVEGGFGLVTITPSVGGLWNYHPAPGLLEPID